MQKELKERIDRRDYNGVKNLLEQMNVVDIAQELEEVDEELTVKVFRTMPKDTAAEVFAYLSADVQQSVIEAITDREIGGIIDELFVDDAVDFLEEMPANVVKRVLATVPEGKRDVINQLLQYPEDSAGSIMTIEYVDLKKNLTVRDAFNYIRNTGVDKETIYTCYVIDTDRKLLGTVSVRTLLLAREEEMIGDIMEKGTISATTMMDKQSLANDFTRYGLLAMPIVDHEQRLVGIVTVDDALTVQEEEATEDFELMAAMSPSDEPYLKTSVLTMTKNRVLWLMLLMLSATVTGTIISGFEDAFAVLPALVAFIPMLMDTAGNSGSQSSTMVIRGMALEQIASKDVLKVLWKEIRVAVLCGAALALVNFGRILLTNDMDVALALTVSITLYITVVMAKSVGCLLPIGAKMLKLDPAVMASPIITTVVDAVTLVIYFGLAKAIFGI